MGCCDNNSEPEIRDIVRDNYGKIARDGGCCSGVACCCGGPSPEEIAKVIGYSPVRNS